MILSCAYIFSQSSAVQTRIIQSITRNVFQNIGADISIERVDYRLFNKIVLKEVVIEDPQQDTLFYFNELIGNLIRFSLSDRNLYFSKITGVNSKIKLLVDEERNINIQYLVDALKSRDTTKTRWHIMAHKFSLQNSYFLYQRTERMKKSFGIDFYNMHLQNMNLDIKDFQIFEGNVTFNINNFSFIEKTGFILENFSAQTFIGDYDFNFEDIQIRTPNSEIKSDYFKMHFNKFNEFQDFNNNILLDWNITSSKLYLHDVAYFSEKLNGFQENLYLTGLFNGRVGNLKGRNIKMKFLNETFLSGNFDILGLPDSKNAFFFFDFKDLRTSSSDLKRIPKYPFYSLENISVPEILNRFGLMQYEGQLSGFMSDFVAYGKFNTDLGKFDTDISFQSEIIDYKAALKGKIETYDFDLGKLIKSQKLFGDVSLSSQINGFFKLDNTFEMTINSDVANLVFNNYDVNNINIEGEFSQNDFNGKVNINDPNLDLEFIGSFDFSDTIPHYNFESQINQAYLSNLNIDPDYDDSFVSAIIKTNFYGNKLDNLKGDINLFNINIVRNEKDVFLPKVDIEAVNELNYKKLALNSDLIKANIEGDYSFNAMLNSIQNFLAFYLPSIAPHQELDTTLEQNKFNFEVYLVYPQPFTDLYFPFLNISPNTVISGNYDILSRNLNLEGKVEYLELFGKTFKDLYLNAYSRDSLISINSGSREFIYNKNHSLKNFSLYTSIQSDSVNINFNWNNWEEINYSGNFSATANLFPSTYKYPKVKLNILPSNIVMADTVWLTNTSTINIDSTNIQFDSFKFYNQEKSIVIDGNISELKSDSLYISINEIPLTYFNLFIQKEGISLDGVINGNSTINDFYRNRIFLTKLNVNKFYLNNELIGNIDVSSIYNKTDKRLEISAESKINKLKNIALNGHYTPENKNLDFSLKFNKFRLSAIEPYVSNIATDVYGLATGDVDIKGTLSDPFFVGNIDVQRGSFVIDYLKTKYSISDEITITPKGFLFNNIDIYDINGNKANIYGYLNHKLFKNMEFDFSIESTNFQMLNTYEKDNPYFYGQAYASGIVKIQGIPENVAINISSKTEKETKIFVPLYGSEEVSQVDFISFVNPADTSLEIEEILEYEADLSGIQMNFDLEVTPDAEIQLIFDKKVGDIIKGRGFSNLKMEIDTRENFNMYGDFTIDDGDYLFTLQNVINKKFDIEPGSTISFNGSPYDALADIRAIYKVRRTSIFEITLDEDDVGVRYPVNCYLIMSNKLMQPDINFDLEIETQDENLKARLKNFTEDEINKQLISLLVINKFQPIDRTSTSSFTENTGSGVGTNVSELLSNQLSHWLSQINSDFDIGVNYRPGNELTTEEYEVALSTQILNDRVTLYGNVGMGGQQLAEQSADNNNSNVMGDFEVDVKLNKSGKLRMKAYTKANEDYIYDDARYKQGLSLYYKEEFNSFRELIHRIFNKEDENQTN